MDFALGLKSYIRNFPTALGFALLLVFVLPFSWLSNSFISSGTVLVGYGFLRAPLLNWVLLLVLVLVFLFFYSLLVCLMVLAVRRDLSKMKTHYYLSEKIHKFAMKYFRFLAVFTVFAAIVFSVLVDLGVPVALLNLFLMLFAASFLFLPQTIVVDEESLRASVLSNWEFIAKNFISFLMVFFFGVAMLSLLQLAEFAVDYVFFGGNFLSLLFALVFLVPFLEVMKTQIYMNRFSLIEPYAPHVSG